MSPQKLEIKEASEHPEEEHFFEMSSTQEELDIDLEKNPEKTNFLNIFKITLFNKIKTILRLDRKKTRSFDGFLRDETKELAKEREQKTKALKLEREKIVKNLRKRKKEEERRRRRKEKLTASERKKIKKVLKDICIWVQNPNSGEMGVDWEYYDDYFKDKYPDSPGYKVIVKTDDFELIASERKGVCFNFYGFSRVGHFYTDDKNKLCFKNRGNLGNFDIDRVIKKLATGDLKASFLRDSFFSFLKGDNFETS
jgi:hypothetical protein